MQLINPGSDRVYYVGGAEDYALQVGAAHDSDGDFSKQREEKQ